MMWCEFMELFAIKQSLLGDYIFIFSTFVVPD